MSGFAFWRSRDEEYEDYEDSYEEEEELEESYHSPSGQIEISYRMPKDTGDARTIADDVKSNVPVIFHMDELDPDLARRFLDYLSGVAYCSASEIRRIAERTYLITPPTVQIIRMQV